MRFERKREKSAKSVDSKHIAPVAQLDRAAPS